MYEDFVRFVRDLYGCDGPIPLHEPHFRGNEKKYLDEAIDSTFVSSVGEFVDEFESRVAAYTGSEFAIATVNGTAALHLALLLAGLRPGDEVITQSLTFVATCNAIRYCDAEPVFVDVDLDTLGLSPASLERFLHENATVRDDGVCWNKKTGRPIRVCLPMHTFGHPVRLDEIREICEQHRISLVEDSAESLGSRYKGRHTGTTGKLAALSFNGNKIITTGGGGMVLTNDSSLAAKAKHLSTTAKKPHRWIYDHDQIGFNYRLPNLNAALGCAQIEVLPVYIENKRTTARRYSQWCDEHGVRFFHEPTNSHSNYWLNCLIMENHQQRDSLLEYTNSRQISTRPAWTPMHELAMNQSCISTDLKNTKWLSERLVNVPSSVNLNG